MMFLGRSLEYWSELDKRFEKEVPTGPALLEEIAMLRGRLSYYENRLKEMAQFMGAGTL